MALILSGDTGVPSSGMPAGSVIQVVTANLATYLEIATTTLTATGLSATITPSSSSSKILIFTNLCTSLLVDSGSGLTGFHQLRRDATQIVYSQRATWILAAVGSSGSTVTGSTIALNYLDSPGTTSAVTYSVYAAPSSTSSNGRLRINDYNNVVGTAPSTMTLMEIKV